VKVKMPRKLRWSWGWRLPQTYTIMNVSDAPRNWMLMKGAMQVSSVAPAGGGGACRSAVESSEGTHRGQEGAVAGCFLGWVWEGAGGCKVCVGPSTCVWKDALRQPGGGELTEHQHPQEVCTSPSERAWGGQRMNT
jgi:hypothetical protein